MSIRMIGAVMILSGCGWFGFSMAASHRNREQGLRQLIRAAEFMECELQFRQTDIPQLCFLTSNSLTGELQNVFSEVGELLEEQACCDVSECICRVLQRHPNLPEGIDLHLMELGRNLGKFDLNGQLVSLRSVQRECELERRALAENRESRLRSYQTLGLCTGAALAILLI